MPKQRQTCTECSMRRQKCDRNIPCSRCIKRGEATKCSREWPGDYDPKLHRIYPKTSRSVSSPINERSRDSSSAPPDSLPHQTPGKTPISPAGTQTQSVVSQDDSDAARDMSVQPHPQAATRPGSLGSAVRNGEIEDAATVLEYLAWGRSKVSDYDVKAPELLKEPHNRARGGSGASTWVSANSFDGADATQIAFLQILLPSPKQIFQLVEYHKKCLLWYHGSYHGPTWYRELNDVCHPQRKTLTIAELDLKWVALLFSILTGSITCASDQTATSWGFKKAERAKLSKQWYRATVACLNFADYISNHHIYSVSAIATLTMSAHTLGFSNDQSVLLGAALKIAQSLGLHRLGPTDESDEQSHGSEPVSKSHLAKIIRRETGRRVWCQLCTQDWFSVPFAESYCISQLHFTTLKPMSCDDMTMVPIPETSPTMTSYGNYLYDIASLMPQLQDAITTSNTLYTKYEQVLEFDAKMRSLATDSIPAFFSMREAIDISWPAFIPWARRSLTICFAHKIMMIHRSFLGRSFTNPAFAFTRRTCIAASKTILKEAKQASDEEGPTFWIDQAFCVAAAITLTLDIFHRSENEPDFQTHRKLVDSTIEMLRKFDNSMIAIRGVQLLSSMLSEQDRMSSQQLLATDASPGSGKRRRSELSGQQVEKRQKFNVPNLVRTFCAESNPNPAPDKYTQNPIDPGLTSVDNATPAIYDGAGPSSDLRYETFAELFPPQTGFGNNFLFEDLLNFDML